ncbi:MAG: MFS transporter [bacterium]|jgi:MFS family permease
MEQIGTKIQNRTETASQSRSAATTVLLSLSHFFCHVAILTYPAILLLIKNRFHTNYEILGTVAGIYLFLFGAGSLPVGFIADKINKKHILRIYLAGMALFSFAAAISGNFYMFSGSIILMGLIGSIYHPVGLSMMSFVGTDKLKAFAIHGIAGTLGVAVSAAFAGILGYFFGYNFPYFILGAVFLILFVLSYILTIGGESAKGYLETENGKEGISLKAAFKGFFIDFFHLNLIIIFIVEFLNGFVFQGVFSFLPAYAGLELKNFLFFHNQAAAAGGFFVTFALIIGVIFQYNSTKITKNYKPHRAFSVLVLISGIFLLISGLTHNFILFASILAFSAFNFSINPISNLMISQNAHQKYRATAYGIFFFAGFGVGSIAAPIGGIIAQRLALHWIFVLYGLVLMTSFLISVAIKDGKFD